VVDPPVLTGGPAGAVASGGPVDGTRLGDGEAESYEVVMADRSRHRYVRTDLRSPDGAVVYRWEGR
jgi:hypothetical protein